MLKSWGLMSTNWKRFLGFFLLWSQGLYKAKSCPTFPPSQCEISLQIFQSQKTFQYKVSMKMKNLLSILVKTQQCKANFWPNGRKIRKNLLLKVFYTYSKKFWGLRPLKKVEEEKKLWVFLNQIFQIFWKS